MSAHILTHSRFVGAPDDQSDYEKAWLAVRSEYHDLAVDYALLERKYLEAIGAYNALRLVHEDLKRKPVIVKVKRRWRLWR